MVSLSDCGIARAVQIARGAGLCVTAACHACICFQHLLSRQTCDVMQPMEIYVDDETKLTLHGLVQHYVMLNEEEKNRKLNDLLDALDFNQVWHSSAYAGKRHMERSSAWCQQRKCKTTSWTGHLKGSDRIATALTCSKRTSSISTVAQCCMQVVIFVKSVARAKELNKLLVECNFPSICIHSAQKQDERYVPLLAHAVGFVNCHILAWGRGCPTAIAIFMPLPLHKGLTVGRCSVHSLGRVELIRHSCGLEFTERFGASTIIRALRS